MEKKGTINTYKPINIKEIFAQKNPGLAKLIPGFVFKGIEHILRIDFFNHLAKENWDKRNFDFASSVLDMFDVTVDVIGEENLPMDTKNIFVSNHPLGGFDGGLYTREIGERYQRNFNMLVNDILMNVKNMGETFIPVNKHGSQGSDNVRRIEELFASDAQVFTFPAGLVSRRTKGHIEDPVWQKNFISKAKSHQRSVVTMHISGRCSNKFYRTANLRKFFRIKANLEMFLLPQETTRQVGKHFTITIGKPISYKTFDKRKKPIEWAQEVKRYCYELANDPKATFTSDN